MPLARTLFLSTALLFANLPAASVAGAQVPNTPMLPGTSAGGAVGETIPFEGGKLIISETPEQEKVLTFDGTELGRNYFLFYERTVTVADVQVALFSIGDGGNACPASALMVWKAEDGIQSAEAGFEDGCGSPEPAATADRLYFVPYLSPGSAEFVQAWSPSEGFTLAGELSFTPQAETTWADIDPAKVTHPYDLFANEDVYAAAQDLLGDDLETVASGLSTSGGPETPASGILTLRGCVPHACGTQDAFMAVDAKGKKLWFAQQTASGQAPKTWPDTKDWPAEVTTAMQAALAQ